MAFPLFLERYTASPIVFFGTLLLVVGVGSTVPLLFGRETVGQLESVTDGDTDREAERVAA